MSNVPRAGRWLPVVSMVSMSTAAAQVIRPEYGVGGGLTVPTGDFHADARGEGYNTGWQGTAWVGFKLLRTSLGIRVDGSYGENGANDKLKADVTAVAGQPADAKTKLLGGSLNLTYEFRSSSPMKAYVLAGIGFYNTKVLVTSGNVTAEASATKLAWNGGAGFSYGVGSAALFLGVRYFAIPSPFGPGSDVRYVPIIVGVGRGGK